MNKNDEKPFASLAPPNGLLNKIMARIREEERLLSLKRWLVLFSAAVMISAGAFIPAINAFRAEFTQSGIGQFLSLIVTDSGVVTTHWQDFGLALLESLPAVSAIALLATMLIFLWSLKYFAQTIKVVFGQPQLINS